jgi:mannose-6-phosphate isomerase-like protein (cupin superfamily)
VEMFETGATPPRSEAKMAANLPEIVTLTSESSSKLSYDNHPVAQVNDHVVRISVMTEPYHWHQHPNSDETFLVVEGRLKIEFDNGSLELGPGQMATVPKGLRHRTSPVGARSVNLTFELNQSKTVAE